MKKEIALVSIALLLIVSPVYAEPKKGNSESAKDNQGSAVSELKKSQVQSAKDENTREDEGENEPDVDVSPTATPTIKLKVKEVQGAKIQQAEDCDPNAEWKNHGAYVSCVAHQKLGGQAVSQAARSDIGKKVNGITPTITPTATPTATLTPTPPLTPFEAEATFAVMSWDNLKKAIAHLFSNIPFFSPNS